MIKNILVLLLISLITSEIYTQRVSDSTKPQKNLRFSILGGLGYTPDYGFLIGGSALLTFSTDTSDTTLKRSVLPLAFAVMFKGGASLLVRQQLFFKNDNFRVFGQLSAGNTLDNYYGV